MFSISCKLKVTLLQWNKKKQLFLRINKPIKYIRICDSSYVIYLMEWILCYKQYVSKAETNFNMIINNYQKDVKKVKEIVVHKKRKP